MLHESDGQMSWYQFIDKLSWHTKRNWYENALETMETDLIPYRHICMVSIIYSNGGSIDCCWCWPGGVSRFHGHANIRAHFDREIDIRSRQLTSFNVQFVLSLWHYRQFIPDDQMVLIFESNCRTNSMPKLKVSI